MNMGMFNPLGFLRQVVILMAFYYGIPTALALAHVLGFIGR